MWVAQAILNLPTITTCVMIQTGDLESSPQRWSNGTSSQLLSYDWLDKSITDLLPVKLNCQLLSCLLFVCLPAYLPACLPACLLACVFACLSACLSVCLPA